MRQSPRGVGIPAKEDLSYNNKHSNFSLSGVDIIGNGMITLTLLITKFVARKRQTLRIQGVTIIHAQRSRTARKHAVVSRHLRLESCFFPLRIGGNYLMLLYAVGVLGVILSFVTLVYDFSGTHSSSLFTQAWGALLCTLIFVVPFATLYQRELFRLLVTSFDFFFYAFQTTTATLSVCVLYGWERSRCLMLFTWWIWIHSALTLDALTPIVREKLSFQPRIAAPAVALVLLGHISLINRIFLVGDEQVHDAVLYQGAIWDHQLVVRAMSFYFSRIVTLSVWCPRLIWRLSISSTSDVSIIRGNVCYDNYFAKRGRRRSRRGTIHQKRQQWLFRRDRVKHVGLPDHKIQSGPTLKSLVAIQPQPEN